MSLASEYDAAVAAQHLIEDPMQRQLLPSLDQLVNRLEHPRRTWFQWNQKPQGFYWFGSVGVGKTFLMDLFYEAVTLREKKRYHFHHFMQYIDAELRALQGQKNPLKRIAADLAKSARLLCLDEFMVNDVAHAMILADLLNSLFAKGIILLATSNCPPDDLYPNGPQRARFLPAIAALKKHCRVVNFGERRDYRLGKTLNLRHYIVPSGKAADLELQEQFSTLAGNEERNTLLRIQNREVACVQQAGRVVWFEFHVLCNLPRSQLDYLEIANRFDTVIVSNLPQLKENNTIFALLLINFVDVMYDQGMQLIISAEVPLEALYVQGEMIEEFKRTVSRLKEMQSEDFLRRHPRRVYY